MLNIMFLWLNMKSLKSFSEKGICLSLEYQLTQQCSDVWVACICIPLGVMCKIIFLEIHFDKGQREIYLAFTAQPHFMRKRRFSTLVSFFVHNLFWLTRLLTLIWFGPFAFMLFPPNPLLWRCPSLIHFLKSHLWLNVPSLKRRPLGRLALF